MIARSSCRLQLHLCVYARHTRRPALVKIRSSLLGKISVLYTAECKLGASLSACQRNCETVVDVFFYGSSPVLCGGGCLTCLTMPQVQARSITVVGEPAIRHRHQKLQLNFHWLVLFILVIIPDFCCVQGISLYPQQLR
jgi:hypothetical protein